MVSMTIEGFDINRDQRQVLLDPDGGQQWPEQQLPVSPRSRAS
jgi:hypothetical protein